VYREFKDQELYEFGVAVGIAVNAPDKLKDLEPRRQMVVKTNMDNLPGMLRIPKKRKEEASDGE
jgi:hypothetical protein